MSELCNSVCVWGTNPFHACLQLEINISNDLFLTAECHANVGTLLPLAVLLGSECASCRQKPVNTSLLANTVEHFCHIKDKLQPIAFENLVMPVPCSVILARKNLNCLCVLHWLAFCTFC